MKTPLLEIIHELLKNGHSILVDDLENLPSDLSTKTMSVTIDNVENVCVLIGDRVGLVVYDPASLIDNTYRDKMFSVSSDLLRSQ